MDDALGRAAARLETVNRRIGAVVRWAALIMALVQFGAVVLRYVFGMNSIFVNEIVLYLNAGLFMLGAGYTLVVDGHVRVDIFYGEASPRHRAWIDLLGTLVLLFPAVAALAFYTWASVANSWAILEGAISVGGVPASFLLKSLIPAFCLLLAIQGAALALRALAVLRGRTPAPPLGLDDIDDAGDAGGVGGI